MNKYSMLVFILILSLILPFFPCFSYVLMADNNISVSVNIGDYDSWSDGIRDKTQGIMAQNGYAVSPTFYDDDSVDGEDIWNWLIMPYTAMGFDDGESSGKPLSERLYDFTVENNIDIDSVINDNDTSLINYVNNQCPYYIYRTMPISTFFSYFVFTSPDADGKRELARFRDWVIPLVNNLDGVSMIYCNYYVWAHDTFVVHYGNLLDDYSFALQSGSFGPYPNLEFQCYGADSSSLPDSSYSALGGHLNLYSNDYYDLFNGSYTLYRGYNGTTSSNSTYSYAYVGFNQLGRFASWHCYAVGSLYVSPDSVGSISFPVFKSSADMQLFYTGRSKVYSFDSDIDLSKYPGINYDRLYDIISTNIDNSTGNILDSINYVANEYLQEQIVLLHDINNALNNGQGQSWLRLIFDLLDFDLPLIINDLSNINDTLSNFDFSNIGGSVSGGSVSVDMTETNTLLSDINDKLGLMIGGGISTDTPTSLASLAESASSRFPFSLVTDVVVIVTIFNHDPVKPDLQMPVPFQPGETWTIDISSYEYLRPFIQGFLIFGFILILIRLSMKILEALK